MMFVGGATELLEVAQQLLASPLSYPVWPASGTQWCSGPWTPLTCEAATQTSPMQVASSHLGEPQLNAGFDALDGCVVELATVAHCLAHDSRGSMGVIDQSGSHACSSHSSLAGAVEGLADSSGDSCEEVGESNATGSLHDTFCAEAGCFDELASEKLEEDAAESGEAVFDEDEETASGDTRCEDVNGHQHVLTFRTNQPGSCSRCAHSFPMVSWACACGYAICRPCRQGWR